MVNFIFKGEISGGMGCVLKSVYFYYSFRFAIRVDSPIHFKRIDSNRFVL